MRAEVRGGQADAVLARARTLGLLGWVREDDDAVRVHAEGPSGAVGALRAFLAEGSCAVVEQPAKVEGHEQMAVRGVAAGRFSMVEHADGYDLRLEVGEETPSWTLRKAPSMRPAERRMAIELAAPAERDDASDWDGGLYEQGGRVAWPEALDRGHAVFVLHGDRLRGGFALQRTRGAGAGAQWLFVKRRDEHAL